MNKDEIIEYLNNSSNNEKLFLKANETRKKYVGDEVHLRALIEFSNICKCNCKYCGLRRENKNLQRYSMTKEEIINQARFASLIGYKTIVLQSGENDCFDCDTICEIIREIKKFDVALTLSIGEKTFEEYREYKKSGADRYLLRIETTDENLYKQMHPNSDFKNRLRCLENLKTLDYEVGCGSLIGLSNQKLSSIADDILFFKENDFDMIGLGPFIPHIDTPLKNEKQGDFNLALSAMALVRIILPKINIPATTAMETIKKDGRILALKSGANVVMLNLNLEKYSKNYEIYPNKKISNDKFVEDRRNLEEKLLKINRKISTHFGASKNKNK